VFVLDLNMHQLSEFESLEHFQVTQCVVMFCSVLQCVAVCWNVLQCAAVCCSVLQCDAGCLF